MLRAVGGPGIDRGTEAGLQTAVAEPSSAQATASDASGRQGIAPGRGSSEIVEGTGRAPRKSEILLGSYGTQSGIIGAALAAFPPAIRAWAADVNVRGGLNGHPVRIILADDKGDPGIALQIARRMVEEQGVLFFFSPFGAATQHAVTPYLEEHRVPAVGGALHEDADRSPMIFNPQLGATKGNRRSYLVTTVVQSRARKVAIFSSRECGATCRNTSSEIKAYAPVVGVTVVHEGEASIAQPDFTAEAITARNAGAEVVILQLDIPSNVRFQRSAHRQGWHPVFVGGPGIYDPNFLFESEEVEGTLSYATLAPYSLSPLMASYRNAMRRYAPAARLADFGAQAWAGGKLLERIGPLLGERPTRNEVLDALWSLRDETLGGIVPPLTFPRGPHVDVNLCGVLLKVSGGRWAAPFGDRFYCATDPGIRTR